MATHQWIFLDRDGVINADSNAYIKSVAECRIFAQAVQAIALLSQAGWNIVVITNQSGIGRGLYTQDTLQAIHAHIRQSIETAGGTLQGFYYCPHTPADHCLCRKPLPGLFLQAIAAHHIGSAALAQAYVIGDSKRDLLAGQKAGIGQGFWVETGKPIAEEDTKWMHTQMQQGGFRMERVADLLQATQLILSRSG